MRKDVLYLQVYLKWRNEKLLGKPKVAKKIYVDNDIEILEKKDERT
jgi:hypothetical protein